MASPTNFLGLLKQSARVSPALKRHYAQIAAAKGTEPEGVRKLVQMADVPPGRELPGFSRDETADLTNQLITYRKNNGLKGTDRLGISLFRGGDNLKNSRNIYEAVKKHNTKSWWGESTGTNEYDNLINNTHGARDKAEVSVDVVMMTPEEYITEVGSFESEALDRAHRERMSAAPQATQRSLRDQQFAAIDAERFSRLQRVPSESLTPQDRAFMAEHQERIRTTPAPEDVAARRAMPQDSHGRIIPADNVFRAPVHRGTGPTTTYRITMNAPDADIRRWNNLIGVDADRWNHSDSTFMHNMDNLASPVDNQSAASTYDFSQTPAPEDVADAGAHNTARVTRSSGYPESYRISINAPERDHDRWLQLITSDADEWSQSDATFMNNMDDIVAVEDQSPNPAHGSPQNTLTDIAHVPFSETDSNAVMFRVLRSGPNAVTTAEYQRWDRLSRRAANTWTEEEHLFMSRTDEIAVDANRNPAYGRQTENAIPTGAVKKAADEAKEIEAFALEMIGHKNGTDVPVLDYVKSNREGLKRAKAAQLLGIKEIPVVSVRSNLPVTVDVYKGPGTWGVKAVEDKSGKRVGSISTEVDTKAKTVKINLSNLEAMHRGRGIGNEMYTELINDVMRSGYKFQSDTTLTKFSYRIWESLEKQGYKLKKNPSMHVTHYGEEEAYSTLDRKPIFTVVGLPPKKTPSQQQQAMHVGQAYSEYEIIDNKTGLRVGTTYKGRVRARHRADKLDNEYGGVRYIVKPIKEGK